MTAANVNARNPISKVSAMAITKPADLLSLAADDRPISRPSTKLSTRTARVKVKGNGGVDLDFALHDAALHAER